LDNAEQIHSAEVCASAIRRLARELDAVLRERHPLVLSVMGGAVVFTGQILPLLGFPLDFDTIHVTRYGGATSGGQLQWHLAPREQIAGRTVLVLDDILDEGQTMAGIRSEILARGAAAFYCAVLTDKQIGKEKPIVPDFVGLSLPNRYVFGLGMDIYGAWRNLPAIYAVKDPG
jgi:hypoxanthine phosphoribosyltransferase